MLNIKAGIMFLLALVLGTGAAMMAYGWIQQQSPTTTSENTDIALVYVAARDVPYGKSLDKTHLKTVEWPADSVPKGAILASEELIGKIVTQDILSEELFLSARVTDKLQGSRLSSIVRPTMRAISVRVNDVAGVAGFLLPGNRVDVLATRMEDRRAITSTLLQNIKVLAVDQKASSTKDEPIVVRAVTLEVHLNQAALLASATEEGNIQLVLRNPEDQSTQPDTNFAQLQPKDAMEIDAQKPAIAAAQLERKVKKRSSDSSLTIIRGTEVVRTNLRQ